MNVVVSGKLPRHVEAEALIVKITERFSGHWNLNDEAHRYSHFYSVYETAMYINQKLDLGYDYKLIVLAAFFHDLFAWSRENHHVLSATYIATSKDPLFAELSTVDRKLVELACLQHRASFHGEFGCVFAELINSADRGAPGDLHGMVERAILFRESKFPEETNLARINYALQHIREKFGSGGYARYPELYERAFPGELQQQRDWVDNLTFATWVAQVVR